MAVICHRRLFQSHTIEKNEWKRGEVIYYPYMHQQVNRAVKKDYRHRKRGNCC